MNEVCSLFVCAACHLLCNFHLSLVCNGTSATNCNCKVLVLDLLLKTQPKFSSVPTTARPLEVKACEHIPMLIRPVAEIGGKNKPNNLRFILATRSVLPIFGNEEALQAKSVERSL